MTQRIVIRPLADRDLDEQAEYFARKSLATARRWYEATEAAFETLAGMPEIGSPWETDNPACVGIRVWRIRGFTKHLIFYRPTENTIEVIRVLHSARDIESLFAAEGN
jgi:toxin ParE1/3/4